MLKVEIKNKNGDKIFFCDRLSLQNFNCLGDKTVVSQTVLTLVNRISTVDLMLYPGDSFSISEDK